MNAPLSFEYNKASRHEIESLADAFCTANGEAPHGTIADSEYDRLFDHLAEALRTHATFAGSPGKADFVGSRYVDQIPWIAIVSKTGTPRTALAAALQAVATAHRPLAVSFDYYPDSILVLPPNRVFTTFEEDVLLARP